MPIANLSITREFDRVWSIAGPNVGRVAWDNASTNIPLIYFLSKTGQVKTSSGGTALREPILKEVLNVINYTPGAQTVSYVRPSPSTVCEYQWKHLVIGVMLEIADLVKTKGPNMYIDMLKLVTAQVKMSMLEALGSQASGVFSNADETQLGVVTGLQNLIKTNTTDNALGTTGTLSRVTNANWRNEIGTAVSAFATNGLSYTRSAQINAQRGNEKTDLVVTTRSALNNYITALQGTITMNVPRDANAVDQQTLDLGIGNIGFYGALLLADANCPATSWYGINTKYLWLQVSSDRNFDWTDWTHGGWQGRDALGAHCAWMGNLVAPNLARHYGVTGVDTA